MKIKVKKIGILKLKINNYEKPIIILSTYTYNVKCTKGRIATKGVNIVL